MIMRLELILHQASDEIKDDLYRVHDLSLSIEQSKLDVISCQNRLSADKIR